MCLDLALFLGGFIHWEWGLHVVCLLALYGPWAMGTDGNAYSSCLMTFVNHVYVHLSGYPWVGVGGRGQLIVTVFGHGLVRSTK